ncbi:MerR family transcriptional regulator [Blautia sp. HCP3S3_H10_1]|uniref:MerR family transcriptional regulator n=1 Tax=unclassified Blautia TaxID=2648079 RepID=UPI003F8D9F31|nr:MerR family transcriptional regulator [Clostridia bacterium]
MTYTVGEMAKLLGVPSSTLRYYDKEGLLPFVERSSSGIRMFHEKDYEWLQMIGCLKKAGMSLKDIRQYIHLAMEGDSTIEERLQLFYRQRELLQAQMEALQRTMDVLDYKCWYYETAKEAGTVQIPQSMSVDELPPQFRKVKKDLVKVPVVD